MARDVDMGKMARVTAEAGISPDLASCHTTLIGGYVVEGHVPAEDIARLLAERPDAMGLAAPGMPAGHPAWKGLGQSHTPCCYSSRRAGRPSLIRTSGHTPVWTEGPR